MDKRMIALAGIAAFSAALASEPEIERELRREQLSEQQRQILALNRDVCDRILTDVIEIYEFRLEGRSKEYVEGHMSADSNMTSASTAWGLSREQVAEVREWSELFVILAYENPDASLGRLLYGSWIECMRYMKNINDPEISWTQKQAMNPKPEWIQ